MHHRRTTRPGFTLIELLVVIFLIGVLATLVGIYVVPAFRDTRNVIRGLDRVTQTLMIAKQRALRDQAPRGVRFVPDPSKPTLVRELRYIEEPPPLLRGTVTILPTSDVATFTGVDFHNGFPTDPNVHLVRPGDVLRLAGPVNYQITSVLSGTTLKLERASLSPVSQGTGQWRILRQPRLLDEAAVAMPGEIVVDLGRCLQLPPNGGNYDILFSPSGEVISSYSGALIVLWVRDETGNTDVPSKGRLLTINPRGGALSAHPVDPPPNQYGAALSGKPSDL